MNIYSAFSRMGLLIILLGISLALGTIANPILGRGSVSSGSMENLLPGEVNYEKVYLMGLKYLIRVSVPDGFHGTFVVMNSDGKVVFRRVLNGPAVFSVSIERRGWHILALENGCNKSIDFSMEIIKTRNPDISALLDAFLVSIAGIVLYLCGRRSPMSDRSPS